MTPELFDVVFSKIQRFIFADTHCNATGEINTFLKYFVKREPSKVAKAIFPLAFQAILGKEEGGNKFGSPLGQYFLKQCSEENRERAKEYSVKKYLSKDHLEYYTQLMTQLIM